MLSFGDTDTIVVAVSIFANKKVLIDNGSGDHRKIILLNELDLSQTRSLALIGISFTSSDYISSFFKKRKEKCWKIVKRFPKFEEVFIQLGQEQELQDTCSDGLEEFVCYLYGMTKSKGINKLRLKIFNKKLLRNHKAADVSTLPPFRQVLQHHARRANAIAYIWRHSTSPVIELPRLEDNGWTSEEEIYWMDDAFPDDVEELLFNKEDKDEDEEDD